MTNSLPAALDPTAPGRLDAPRESRHGMSSIVRRVLKGSGIYGLGSVITKVASLLLTPLYTHYLTPAHYGILATAIVLTSSLEMILALRLDAAFSRFYFDAKDDRARLNRTVSSLSAAVLGCAATSLMLLWLAGQHVPALHEVNGVAFDPYLKIVLATAFFSVIGALPMTLLQVQERAKTFALINLARFFLNTGCTIYLVAVLKGGAAGSLWGTLIGNVAFAAVCLVIIAPYLELSFDRRVVREALSFSLPLLPHAISLWALTLSDRLILGMFVSLDQVGIYALGYNLGMGMLLVVSAFTGSWAPIFFDTLKRDEAQGAQELGKIITHVMTGLILIALAGMLVAREAVMLLAPPKYGAAAAVIPWVIAAYVFHGMYICFVNVLFYFKKTGVLPFITGGAAALNILLNLLLVPRFGIMAAAWNTALAYMIPATLVYLAARRLLRLPINAPRLLWIAALSGLVLLGCRWLPGANVGLSLLLKALVYALFLALLLRVGLLPQHLLAKVPLANKMRRAGSGP